MVWVILNNGRYVGRPLKEDKTFNPKPIRILPKDAKPDEISWELEGDHIGGYIAKIRGAPTAPGFPPEPNDKVFALLGDQDKAEKWHFVPVPQHGLNQFIIVGHDQSDGKGWVAPQEVGEQINYKLLIVQPSYPPRYPSSEVFEIKQVVFD
ncbi:hypothetical protein GYMLUDRAFT_248386 [Collybiopsis luxurians FD-317 M1]|uniref:Uncharacterized protein n=1 Tax=Collybiopsis luxurians FD-317 M1 TaxID=944289 RepID=A0A0D0CKW1_9AGAR|nr:hypothetical protein GYMLUDRAFT_248386 [Collybiopsis luxurians FD-317 M1]